MLNMNFQKPTAGNNNNIAIFLKVINRFYLTHF